MTTSITTDSTGKKMEVSMTTFRYGQQASNQIPIWLYVTTIGMILLRMLFATQHPVRPLCDALNFTDTSVNYTFTSQL